MFGNGYLLAFLCKIDSKPRQFRLAQKTESEVNKMKKPAKDHKGKLYFMYTRHKNAVEIEIGRGKLLAVFRIYDDGTLDIVSVKTRA